MSQDVNETVEKTVQSVVLTLQSAGCFVDVDKIRRIRTIVTAQWETDDDRSVDDRHRMSAQNRYRAHWRWKKKRSKEGHK